jgi:hypothetical protein
MSHQVLPSDGESVTVPTRGAAAAQQPSDDGLSPRTMIFGVIAAALAVIAVLVVLKVLFAENIPDLSEESLRAAKQRWERLGPASYDLDLEIRGAQPGIVHVEVRDGAVTAAVRDGRATPERTWDEWSVPGQFNTLERELELAEDPQHEMDAPPGAQLRLRCEFDPQLGFPRRYHRHATGGAPEVFWRATSFKSI